VICSRHAKQLLCLASCIGTPVIADLACVAGPSTGVVLHAREGAGGIYRDRDTGMLSDDVLGQADLAWGRLAVASDTEVSADTPDEC
jgi:hypothetical protein